MQKASSKILAGSPSVAGMRTFCGRWLYTRPRSMCVKPEFRCKSGQQGRKQQRCLGVVGHGPGVHIAGFALPVSIYAKGKQAGSSAENNSVVSRHLIDVSTDTGFVGMESNALKSSATACIKKALSSSGMPPKNCRGNACLICY